VPTETLNFVLSGALAILLLIMAGLLVALFRRSGRAAAPRAQVAVSQAPRPEAIASMADREAEPLEGAGAATASSAAADPGPEGGATDPAPADAAGPEQSPLHLLTDPATGLDNRWAWDRLVHEENLRRSRYSHPISVIVVELNGIDKLAQRVGQEPADRLVMAIGEALRRYSRSCDRIARVEYARFYLLLPETDEAASVILVERVRQACDLWLEAGAVALRLSMGWATAGPDESIEAAMGRARERLMTEIRQGASHVG
jgi:diguanylate cyclase (GGDEF)-like protein